MLTPTEFEATRRVATARATELVEDTGSSPMDERNFLQLVGNEAMQYLQMLYEPLDIEFRTVFAQTYREQERLLLQTRAASTTAKELNGELTYNQCRGRLSMFLNWLKNINSTHTISGGVFSFANSTLLDMYLDDNAGLYIPNTAPGTAAGTGIVTGAEYEFGDEHRVNDSIQEAEQAVQDHDDAALHRLPEDGSSGRVGSDARHHPDAPGLRDQTSKVEFRPHKPAAERQYVGYVHLGGFWGQDRSRARTVAVQVPKGARFLDLMLTPNDGVVALAEFPRHLGYDMLDFAFFIFPCDQEPEIGPNWQYIGMVSTKQQTLVVYRT